MTPFREGESVSLPSESRQWRRDRGSEIKPSASAGVEFGRKKAISLDNICQMWKRPLRRGSTSVFANEK